MKYISFLFLLIFIPSSGCANTWPLYLFKKGSVIGESGVNGLEDTEIIHENLFIRFVPENDSVNAEVIAEYLIDHKGGEKNIDMVFICGSETSEFSLMYDGTKIETGGQHSVTHKFEGIPERLPGILDKPDYVSNMSVRGDFYYVPFKISLQKGRHTITAKYLSETGSYSPGHSAVMYFQFIYVLFPAKVWGDFGTLDITIDYPEGWHIASEPALNKKANQINGTFSGIPSEFLTVSLAAPNNYKILRIIGILANIIAIACIVLLLTKMKYGPVKLFIGLVIGFIVFYIVRIIGIKFAMAVTDHPEFVNSVFVLKHYKPLFSIMIWIGFFYPVTLLIYLVYGALISIFHKLKRDKIIQ